MNNIVKKLSDKEELDILSKIPESPSGVSCKFVSLDNIWGIKLYRSDRVRDLALKMQHKCFKKNLAPKVGCKVNLRNTLYRYGYLTENVKTLAPINLDYGSELFIEKFGKKAYEDQIKINTKILIEYKPHIDEIEKKLLEITGWKYVDRHIYNWGFDKAGNLIFIDFS